MKKAHILLSDTHFGVKNNSVTWLNSQLKFFTDQVIPTLKKYKNSGCEVVLSHLGDLFDSRSSVNPMIVYNVNNILKLTAEWCDRVIIIGGNHDYYSPTYSKSYNINTLDLLKLDDSKFSVITDSAEEIDGFLYMPWFEFHNTEKFSENCEMFSSSLPIMTHADLEHLSEEHERALRGRTVISGHIHTPSLMKSKGADHVHLGSCYPLTFADANQERGMYIIEDDDIDSVKFVANTSSIQFYRLYGDAALNSDIENAVKTNDYVEIYLKNSEYSAPEYINIITVLNKNTNCSTVITPDEVDTSSFGDVGNFDIIDLCRSNIPDHLSEKFEKIAQKH